MDPLDAALSVLREEGGPLHWTKILDLALRGGHLDPLADPRGKLVAALAEAARDPAGPIVKVDKGVYALRGVARPLA